MAERSWFFNAEQTGEDEYDRVYLAEDFAKYFSLFISNGVFPNPSTGLQIVAADTPNMTVIMKPGFAFINGYAYENTSDYVFNIDVADGVLDRVDSFFIRFYLADRTIKAYKDVGKPSSEATPGDLIRTEDYWDLCVGQLLVKHGVTSITQSAITDTRLDTELCGIVHSVVDHIDTKTLYAQIQADLAEFKNVSQMEFDAWFEAINQKLGEEPATALQKQINEIEPEIAHLYKATLSIDGWVAGDTFAYIQTVPLLAIGTGPQVDSDSVFCSGAMCEQTASPETNQFLVEALGIINIGRVTLGSDTVTVEVSEKPEIEIEAIWQIKRG